MSGALNNRQDFTFFGDLAAQEALASSLARPKRWSQPGRSAIAVVRDGALATASVNAPLEADYEIGSVSKGLTGLLYADAVERGELLGSTTLGELLPLDGSPIGPVTVESVSRHSSGLPRLAASGSTFKRTVALLLRGENPYGETLEELLLQARNTQLSSPTPRYSNLGFELLGHGIAAKAGSTYRDLVARRLTEPLGLRSLYAPDSPGELRETALMGKSLSGRPMQPWTGEALAPAGGWRGSILDMGELLRSLLQGAVPGSSALDPVAHFSGPAVRIGAAWLTLEIKGRSITMHNGATGGFRSWMGMDREARTGVVLLSATAAPVDRHGFRLLQNMQQ